jgi:hypothetical protein
LRFLPKYKKPASAIRVGGLLWITKLDSLLVQAAKIRRHVRHVMMVMMTMVYASLHLFKP